MYGKNPRTEHHRVLKFAVLSSLLLFFVAIYPIVLFYIRIVFIDFLRSMSERPVKVTVNKSPALSVDTSRMGADIWMVKVPRFISKKWDKAPSGLELGKIKINPGIIKSDVNLLLSESMLCLQNEKINKGSGDSAEPEPIPKDYKLYKKVDSRQKIFVLSVTPPSENLEEDPQPQTDKLAVEGFVNQKFDCRPINTENYMKLKMASIIEAQKPTRIVKTLDKVVQNYKPIANHSYLKDYDDKKKLEGKRSREDKNDVMEMLFRAFSKHQYYNIRDLVNITNQPVGYLKDILKEVCNHNMKNPHKNMWELKPEYRCYEDDDRPSSSKIMKSN